MKARVRPTHPRKSRMPRYIRPPKGFEEFDERRETQLYSVEDDGAHGLINRSANYDKPPRKRSRSNIDHSSDKFTSYRYSYESDKPSAPKDDLSPEYTNFGNFVTYGSNIPSYRRRIADGLSATTSATGKRFVNLAAGSYRWDLSVQAYSGNPNSPFPPSNVFMSGNYAVGAIPNPSLSFDADVDNQALTNFIRKARKAQTSSLGGEFLHDLSSTLNSFHKYREVFRKSFTLFSQRQLRIKNDNLRARLTGHRSNRLNISIAHKQLAENYLEWTYGIIPTVSDLEDQAFGVWRAYDRSRHGFDSVRVFGFASKETMSSATSAISPSYDGSHVIPRVVCKDSTWDQIYIEYYGSVRSSASNSFVGNVGEELGFGLRSFVPTIWECIPYSFVVDYFTNVGQIIDALVFPSSDVKWINKLVRRETITTRLYSTKFAIPLNPLDITIRNNFSSSPHVFKTTSFQRSSYTGSLVPSFRWHLPYRGTDWVNLLALGISRFL